MVGVKKVLVDGNELYYPVSELEMFTDSTAKVFNMALSSKAELNTEVVPEWFYEKEGKLILPSKRVLIVSYTSRLEENLLKKESIDPGEARFFERHSVKIMDGDRHKETVAVDRLADSAQYNLLYALDRSADSIERYGENEEFRELFDDLFSDCACRRYLEKGISHSRNIELTDEDTQKLLRLYSVIVKEN
ncbi:MAG: hypothetical protein QW666_02815 [Candidatus Woesearchaeota archaeon]